MYVGKLSAGCRYRLAASVPHFMDDKATDAAEQLASQPAAAGPAVEAVALDTGHQGASGGLGPPSSIEARPDSCGEDQTETINGAGEPGVEAEHGKSLIRIVIDEARGLPEAASGARTQQQPWAFAMWASGRITPNCSTRWSGSSW